MSTYTNQKSLQLCCQNCGSYFSTNQSQAKFCSDCRLPSMSTASSQYNISTSQVGSLAEHISVVQLLASGYSVFKNVSAHGSVDLIIITESGTKRIDVKSGRYDTNRKYISAPVLSEDQVKQGTVRLCVFDIDQVYIDDGTDNCISLDMAKQQGIASIWGSSLEVDVQWEKS